MFHDLPSCASTDAPTIGAPETSVTVPVMVAVTSCPHADNAPLDAANRTTRTVRRSSNDGFSRIIFLFSCRLTNFPNLFVRISPRCDCLDSAPRLSRLPLKMTVLQNRCGVEIRGAQ